MTTWNIQYDLIVCFSKHILYFRYLPEFSLYRGKYPPMTTRSVHAALIPPQRSSRHPSIFLQVRGLSAFSVSTFVSFNWISLNCSWIFSSPSTIKLCPKCYSYFLSLVLPWKMLQEFIERPQYTAGRRCWVKLLESQFHKLNVWDNMGASVRPLLYSKSKCQNILRVWHLGQKS